MKFTEIFLKGALVIELEPIKDERGFFARSYCKQEFADHGIECDFVQCNISHNERKGTLRGMHYQAAPYEEDKLVSCIRGAIYDVIVDIRPNSETYKQWFAIELTDTNRKMLYVPKGFAHGYQALLDDTDVFYQVSHNFVYEAGRGLHWNDPAFHIEWPVEPTCVSIKDQSCSLFES